MNISRGMVGIVLPNPILFLEEARKSSWEMKQNEGFMEKVY